MSKQFAGRIAATAGVVVLVGVLAVIGKAWWDSRIPGTYSVMSYGTHEYGGGLEPPSHEGHGVGGTSVADLHGPSDGPPDDHFELTARAADVSLASGRIVHALTFNGKSPGPELRVRQGDLVEVVLRNEDVDDGVTIHWHGVDVPDAEDGVAGVTQNAVLPGESYTYRFRAAQLGTFWYHTHQVSSEDVQRGLFGALVIEPRNEQHNGIDWALAIHAFDGLPTINANDGILQRAVRRNTPVRLRLINTDSFVQRIALDGVPFRVTAIDGTDLSGPTDIEDQALQLPAGGRIDVSFVMPASPVQLSLGETNAGVVLSADGTTIAPIRPLHEQDFDPLTYGRPAPTPFSASSTFDREFSLRITKKLGFFDGRPGRQWALNGGIYPDVPMFVVETGDLVRLTITNDTSVVHPMHLHGHHALVLSRNGQPATGSPWWTDTLNVDPGDEYVIAFRADNPGLWMEHCHNLGHAAAGLTMHVAYAGITTPFLVGSANDNTPE
jgi:FtsP/CotA-like multicopper oxidase with cupredoxin domain